MTPPLALQLYTLRDRALEDFEGTVRHVADMGYAGVETAGVYGESPQVAARLLRDLGLEVTSIHAPLPLVEKLDQSVELAGTFGTRRVVCAWYPPERFSTRAGVAQVCEELNRAAEALARHGLELLYHNHWQECGEVEGQTVYRLMLGQLDPAIGFEPDLYWAQTAGLDPAEFVRELGARAPLLHIKDGPAVMDEPMTAVGQGVLDFRAIAEAGGDRADWWIVELDRCATDILQAAAQSYTYLTRNGLAHGKR